MDDKDKKFHDLKFELRQLRLRCDKHEQMIEALEKMMVNQIIFTHKFSGAFNELLDALDKKEKEDKK